jgi:Zn-finger nucleic acid-binding protein
MESTPGTKKCPIDGNDLTSIEHPVVKAQGCHKCGGIWIAQDQFSHIVKHADELNDAENECINQAGVITSTSSSVCPNGHGTMLRFFYAGDRHITIDRCTECQGIWLDDGECRILAQRLEYVHSHQPGEAQMAIAEMSSAHVQTISNLSTIKSFCNYIGQDLLGLQNLDLSL